MSASLSMATTGPVLQKTLPAATQKKIEENAHNYVSFLMSTFAQVMLEARG